MVATVGIISNISNSVDGIFIPLTPVSGSDEFQRSYIRLYTRNNKKIADISIGITNATTGAIKATYNYSLFTYAVVLIGAGIPSGIWEPIILYINEGNVTVVGTAASASHICCGATVVLS